MMLNFRHKGLQQYYEEEKSSKLNYRIILRFEDGDIHDVDYVDYR